MNDCVGDLDAGKISQAIRKRNMAEASMQGMAARLLTLLHVSESADTSLDAGALRDALLPAVLACDIDALGPLLERARIVRLL